MNSYTSVDGAAVRRVEADPRRPAARRARLHGRGRRRLLHDRAADHAPPRRRERRAKPAKRALEAGLDMELPQLDCYGAPLRALVEAGEVDVALVDRSVRRVLALKESLGLFEQPVRRRGRGAPRRTAGPPTARCAREAAAKSIVLLENDGDCCRSRPGRARRGDRSRRRRRAPAAGRLLVPGAHRDRASRATATTGILPQAGGAFAPARTTPTVGHAARRHPRRASSTSTYAQGLRPHGARTTELDGAGRRSSATPTSRCAASAVESGCSPDCTSGEFRDATDLGLPGVQRGSSRRVVATGTPTGRRRGERPRRTRCRGSPSTRAALVVRVVPGRAGRRGARRRAVRRRRRVAAGCRSRMPRNVGPGPGRITTTAPAAGAARCSATTSTRPPSPLYPFGHGLLVHDVRVRQRSTSSAATHRRGVHGVGRRRATRANAPAPRSCSATCATRSPAWLGPASSSRASPASTSNPARARRCRFTIDPTAARLLRRGHAARRSSRAPSASWSGPCRRR